MNQSLQVQTPRTGTNADYNPTLQPPPQASTSSERTQLFHTEGQFFSKKQGDYDKTSLTTAM